MTRVTSRWDEGRDRLRDLELRHGTNLGVLKGMGYSDDHPHVTYHLDLLAKVHQEMGRIGMETWEQREQRRQMEEPHTRGDKWEGTHTERDTGVGGTGTIEAAMDRRAWQELKDRDDGGD
jgi:hypothetical protein